MQTFICPDCGEESAYDPWRTSARCPSCGYTPPKKMQTGYHITPKERQRISRLKSMRAWLIILLISIIPSLVVLGVFWLLPRLGLEGRAAAWGLVGIIGGIIGLLFLPSIIGLFIVERLIARALIKTWQHLADQVDLTFNPKGGPGRLPIGSVSGTYKGHHVEIFVQAERRKLRTCVILALNQPVELEMKILLSGDTTTQGQVPIREATFEQVATIEGTPGVRASEALVDDSLQKRLLRIHRGSIIWLRYDTVTLQQHATYGIERDIAYLINTLETLSVLADAVESNSIE